jgi:cellulose biosynthesis protein BcsQ
VSTKAIVIHANPAVQEWVGSLKEDWDVQVPVPSASVVWDYLDDGSISQQSEAVFISDLLFLEEPDEFAVVAASFAPTALVIVTVENPDLVQPITDAIRQAVSTYDQIEEGPYYFFDTSNADPAGALDEIINQYSAYLSGAQNTPATAPAQESVQPAGNDDLTGLESFDPTVPQPSSYSYDYDVEDAPAAPATNPSFSPEPQAQATSTAARHFDGYTADEVAEIQNNLGEPGLIIASTSSKGGSGKTTNAMCTAITIAMGSRLASEQGSGTPPLKVCVVDMDVRDGQIGFSINQNSPSILTLYVNSEENITIDNIQKNVIHVPRFEIDCLLAPKRGRTADYLTPQFYLDVLHKLRLMYDLIILDTSVNYLDPLLGQVVYPESDAILLVTNLSKGAVLGMPRWMEEITSGEDGGPAVEKDKIGVVINQSLGGVGMDLDLVRRAAKGAPLLVAIPADNRAVTKASNEGTLNDLIRKHTTIGAEYFKLAQKVWRKTPLLSPLEDYLNSPEKERDDALAAKGKEDNSNAVSTFTPLAQVESKPKRLFGRK